MIAAADEPPTAVAEAQNIQAQLKNVGIEMEIETLELGVYVDRWLKADFDAAVALNGGNPDPDIMFFRYWHSTGNLNKVAAYKNEDIDKLLEQGRQTSDPAKRKDIYAASAEEAGRSRAVDLAVRGLRIPRHAALRQGLYAHAQRLADLPARCLARQVIPDGGFRIADFNLIFQYRGNSQSEI